MLHKTLKLQRFIRRLERSDEYKPLRDTVLPQAEDKLADLFEDAIQIIKLEAQNKLLEEVFALDEKQPLPQDHRIRLAVKRDENEKLLAHHRKSAAALDEFEKDLLAKATQLLFENEASKAGSISPALTAKVLLDECKITPQIGDEGMLVIDRRDIENRLLAMKGDPDLQMLFGDRPQQCNTTDDHPKTIEEHAEYRRRAAEAEKIAALKDALSRGNPWLKGPAWNLTRQGMLVRHDPDKARELIVASGEQPAKFGL